MEEVASSNLARSTILFLLEHQLVIKKHKGNHWMFKGMQHNDSPKTIMMRETIPELSDMMTDSSHEQLPNVVFEQV